MSNQFEPIDVTECESMVSSEYRSTIENYLVGRIDKQMDSDENKKFKKDKQFRNALEYFLCKKKDILKRKLMLPPKQIEV